MEQYKNYGGHSGVVSYLIEPEAITVKFRDGTAYYYTSVRPGHSELERMKQLAIQGYGLNSYISGTVKKNYDKKIS